MLNQIEGALLFRIERGEDLEGRCLRSALRRTAGIAYDGGELAQQRGKAVRRGAIVKRVQRRFGQGRLGTLGRRHWIAAGLGRLVGAGMRSARGEQVALVGMDTKGRIEGLLFELTVDQRFRNATASNIEAVYTFPLPHDAVLLDLEVVIGVRTLKGVVVEKRTAEKSYEKALDEGHTAIMIERAGDGLLTANFGNLLPGEEAVIRYSFAQLLRLEHDAVRVTVPTVIAPRYGEPSDGGLQAHQAPTHDLAVGYPFSLAIDLRGAVAGGEVTSPSHAIALEHHDDRVVARLDAVATLDRDFVLTIANVDQRSLATVERDCDGFVALASFRVDAGAKRKSDPLRLKILLDCSGSMNGDSIDAARRALRRVLAALVPDDHFSVSRFGSRVEHKTMGLVAARDTVVAEVARAIAEVKADLGGTEMQRALEAVFAIDAEGRPADVLLITDGEIWAADALIVRARKQGQRVFVVGVGTAPAQTVLRRLADATGGGSAFVAPAEDPEDAIVRTVERLRAPRVARVDVAWPGTPEWCTTPPTGVFAGETVHVFAGFKSVPKGDASLQAHAEGGEVVSHACVALPAASRGATLARIAAAMRLPSLDDDQTRLDLALRYSLLTERTNLLAVHARAEAERANELPKVSTVPQMHAAGWAGMGSVHEAPMFSLDLDYVSNAAPPRPDLAVIKRGRRPISAPAPLVTVEAVLSALDDRIARLAPLPATLGDLEHMGLSVAALDALRALAALGHDESMIVEAFLEALAARASRFGPGRRLVRITRTRGRSSAVTLEVRASVDVIVANLRLRPVINERLLEALAKRVS